MDSIGKNVVSYPLSGFIPTDSLQMDAFYFIVKHLGGYAERMYKSLSFI